MLATGTAWAQTGSHRLPQAPRPRVPAAPAPRCRAAVPMCRSRAVAPWCWTGQSSSQSSGAGQLLVQSQVRALQPHCTRRPKRRRPQPAAACPTTAPRPPHGTRSQPRHGRFMSPAPCSRRAMMLCHVQFRVGTVWHSSGLLYHSVGRGVGNSILRRVV